MSTDLRLITVPALEAVPGLVHGFEQRSLPRGTETRRATRRRVAAALAPWGRLLLMEQVHGAAVAAAPWDGAPPRADASVAAAAGILLGIETADCLPILLVDPRRRLLAAVHAGWRGTVAGVAARAVEALRARGSDPRAIVAALGPAIGPCCYEVGDELRPAFGPDGGAFFRQGPGGRTHLDLRTANLRQLEAAGVASDRVHHVAECTGCLAERYHSYRREGRGSGRMISFVGWARA